MFHHVPSRSLQDQVMREAYRVLRPGGRFLAVDAIDNEQTRELHVDDTFVPLDAETAADRLATAGFRDISVELAGHRILLVAGKG